MESSSLIPAHEGNRLAFRANGCPISSPPQRKGQSCSYLSASCLEVRVLTWGQWPFWVRQKEWTHTHTHTPHSSHSLKPPMPVQAPVWASVGVNKQSRQPVSLKALCSALSPESALPSQGWSRLGSCYQKLRLPSVAEVQRSPQCYFHCYSLLHNKVLETEREIGNNPILREFSWKESSAKMSLLNRNLSIFPRQFTSCCLLSFQLKSLKCFSDSK